MVKLLGLPMAGHATLMSAVPAGMSAGEKLRFKMEVIYVALGDPSLIRLLSYMIKCW